MPTPPHPDDLLAVLADRLRGDPGLAEKLLALLGDDDRQAVTDRTAVRDALANDLAEAAGLAPEQAAEHAATVMAAVDRLGAVEAAEPVAPVETRTVKIVAEKLGKTTSFKLSNLSIDMKTVGLFAAESIYFGIGHALNPIVSLLGALLLLRCATEAMTVHLSEQEASVFLGLIRAQVAAGWATEAAITTATNAERAKQKLGAMDQLDVGISLERLKKMGSVAPHAGGWKTIERYKVL